ncbi:uncharacterized protein TCAP_02535 [Tolypocladium capitatum]|uniref:Uncharacterized protein n=1 Tax=Tolypocladium capitatum TaxID=45235 RepID=A0A2K3QJ26_9HYPO|nr:uncharacterized protein TCAP_02535 [Tolypocladium capitatum]
MPNAFVHPVVDHEPAVPIPPARRVLEHRQQRPRQRMRHQRVVAARAQQHLLAAHAGVQDAPQAGLLGGRQRHGREAAAGAEEDGARVVRAAGGQERPGEEAAAEQRRRAGVEVGPFGAVRHEAWWWR